MFGAKWLGLLGLSLAVSLAAAAPLACGGGDAESGGTGGRGGASSGDSTGVGFGGQGQQLASITVDPAMASLESLNGAKPTQAFHATAHYADGSSSALSNGLMWTASSPQIGAIDGTGLYTAGGSVGGAVTITATYGGKSGTAKLDVKIHLQQNPVNAPPNVQMALSSTNVPDASVVWAYPYDGTVWPRGLLPPILMWNGGAAADIYLVHLKNPSFELEAFVSAANAPASQVPIDPTTWQQFVDSSSGSTVLSVARWDGQAATIIASHSWGVASASMKGTIYYWSNNLGRVLRIQPGAAQPDDFANQPPLDDPAQFPQSGCLMTCHTVSADGSTLVSGGGTFGGSYDLKTGMPITNLGFGWGTPAQGWQNIQWLAAAVSPTGKYVAVNAQANQLSSAVMGPTNMSGLYTTSNGAIVPNSGLDGLFLYTPAWSPPGNAIAYVTANDSPWASAGNGDLHVMSFDENAAPMAANDQLLITAATNPGAPNVSWPTFTPDGKWIVFQRGVSSTTWSGHTGDLAITSATPGGAELPLDALDGAVYAFAAGDRDRHLNFEPAFAPVAAGGYFWVVFTSRRTYGNALTGDATVVKQLWVAAIDEHPQPGKDPSHPAFHLTGQDEQNLAMRAFWALAPCKGDGQGCTSGTDCCGGYCSQVADAGGPVCVSVGSGCSQDGDKCDTDADCCNATQGSTCINHVCSEPPPN